MVLDEIRWKHRWLALEGLMIAVAAAALRARHLSAESVWLDEYFSMAYLDAPNLWRFLFEQRGENWEMVPLYYALQYGWAQVFGTSPEAIRWLSILFGAGAAGLIYVIGKLFFGRIAGLVAGLCMVLSPFQIFHAQGIRPYSLMALLGALALLSLFQACESGRRGWRVLNVAANVSLWWTHLFGVLALIPQGMFLLLRGTTRGRPFALWTAVHAIMLIPLAAWIRSMVWAPDPPLGRPPWREFTNVLLCSDGEYFRCLIGYPDKSREIALTALQDWLLDIRSDAETALVRVLLLGSSLAFWRLLTIAVRRLERPMSTDESHRVFSTLLVFLWYAVPLFALYAMALLWKPHSLQARYLIYAYPGLYLIVGAGIAGLRWPVTRVLCGGALIALMGLQTLMADQFPMRTDYLSASRQLRAEARPGELVIVPDWNDLRVLEFNLGSHDLRIARHDYQIDAWEFIEMALGRESVVWVVMGTGAEADEILPRLERFCRDRDIPFTRTVYLGMRNLYLYRCAPKDAIQAATERDTALRMHSPEVESATAPDRSDHL